MGLVIKFAFVMMGIAILGSLLLGLAVEAKSVTPTIVSAAQTDVPEPEKMQASPSCAEPDAANAERCRQLVAHILAATLRLKIEVLARAEGGGYEVVDASIGHATVMAGRYLVTHNHFSLSLEDLDDGHLRRLSAYGPDGSVIVQHASFHVFDVLIPQPQMLVFDFGTYGREGALAYAGFASAQFADWQTLGLQPGDEVAQVNWDGRSTFVEWVRVSRARDQDGTPALELDSYVAQGASGGGIFYQGYHVGNNWFHGSAEHATSGEVLWQFTVAALNGEKLLALAHRDPDVVAPFLIGRAPPPEMGKTGVVAQ